MAFLVGAIVQDLTGTVLSNIKGQALGGPFYNGSDIYSVFGTVSGAGAIRIFKSSDAGATWNEMDAAGSPTFSGQLKNQAACQSGNKLFITWLEISGTYKLQMVVFTMGPDTYGANVAGPDTGLGAFADFGAGSYPDNNYQVIPQVRPDGNISVVFTSSGANLETSYAAFNVAGNSWGAAAAIASSGAGTDFVPAGLYIDPSGRHYVVLLTVDNAGVITLSWVTLSSVGAVINGPTALSTACYQPGPSAGYAATCVNGGYVDPINNQVVVLRTNTAGNIGISVAPFGDAPVWTDHDSASPAYVDNWTQSNGYQLAQAFPAGANPTVIYYDDGTGAGNLDANLNQLTFNTGTLTWGAPVQLIADAMTGLGASSQKTAISARNNPVTGVPNVIFNVIDFSVAFNVAAAFGGLAVAAGGTLTIRFGGMKVYS